MYPADELIRDVLLWIPTHGRAKAGRPARTYIQQLCEDTGCCPEDLPRAMNDREEWRERVRDIRAASTRWWWWWYICIIYMYNIYIYIYMYDIYMCVCVCVCVCVSACVWLNNKDTFCLYNVIKILSMFPDKCRGFRLELVDEFTKIACIKSVFKEFWKLFFFFFVLFCFYNITKLRKHWVGKNWDTDEFKHRTISTEIEYYQKIWNIKKKHTCKQPLMIAYERSESARDNFGKFIHQFQPETRIIIIISRW